MEPGGSVCVRGTEQLRENKSKHFIERAEGQLDKMAVTVWHTFHGPIFFNAKQN